jgi:hypothetical protein
MNFSENIKNLEKIKKYLFGKKGTDNANQGLICAEINALEDSIEFINLVLNTFPKGIIQKIINTGTVNNSIIIKELMEKYDSKNDDEIIEEENYENIYIDEIKLMTNYKLSYSIIKYKENKYIIIEPKKFIKSVSEWKNWENFKFPMEILNENQNKKRINKENRS